MEYLALLAQLVVLFPEQGYPGSPFEMLQFNNWKRTVRKCSLSQDSPDKCNRKVPAQ